jgi:sugar lactone lactonase YvrE
MRRAVLATLLAAAGCASAPPKPSDKLVWPIAPDKPRVRYVRTYRTAADLDASGWQRFRRAIVGVDTKNVVINPTALALSPDETRLYVSCSSSGRVLQLDFKEGTMTAAANEDGHRPKHPFGLATDAQGNLYVADEMDKVVWVYLPTGGFLRQIGRGLLDRPTGIAIDRRREILYVSEGGRVDNGRHQIEVFSLAGEHLNTIGKRGTGPGEFNFPSYLAVSEDGTLFVSDTLNFRIQKFDREGNLLGFFGSSGSSVGGFNKIKGLAFDNAGLLHVADSANSFVQIYNSRQQLLLPYGGPGAVDGLMASPTGIAIDSRNTIYVSDLTADRISQYVLVDTSGADGEPAAAGKTPPAPPK